MTCPSAEATRPQPGTARATASRTRTATLGEFIRTVARFNTYDAFLAYLEE